MDNNIAVLSELIEHCSEANRLLVANAISMENGDIKEAQSYTREVSSLLAVILKDAFVETKEILSVSIKEEESYDYSTLDIAKLLSKVCYNAASLINCYVNDYSETIKTNIETKLNKCINATETLVKAILLN